MFVIALCFRKQYFTLFIMLDDNQIDDYTSKLKRYLTTPSSTKEYFDAYHADASDDDFSDYTQALEDLVTKLEEKKIKDREALCKEVKRLKLPHNQFDC